MATTGCLTPLPALWYLYSMVNANPTTIYKKLNLLEQELQRLKIETYRMLPRGSRAATPYAEAAVEQALKQTRESIWQKRYAKKVARVR